MDASTRVDFDALTSKRCGVLVALTQPLTAGQLRARTGLSLKACCTALEGLRSRMLVTCLTPASPRARLYWRASGGEAAVIWAMPSPGLPALAMSWEKWQRYAQVCHRHRTAVILTLDQPLQPATIARRARFRDRSLRMSANNTRDVLRSLVQLGVVEPVQMRKRVHRRYQLTPFGCCCQNLLRRAATKPCQAT